MLKLFLAFTLIPAFELFLLLQIGSWLGPLNTFLLIIITGTVGAWLAKREGLGVIRQLSEELQEGLPPGSRLMEGALVVVGGVLLITPGIFTDLTGFLLIFPASRRWLAPRVMRYLASKFTLTKGGTENPEEPLDESVSYRKPGPHHAPSAPKPFANPFDDL